MHRKEMTLKRNFQKLRESLGVRYESVGRGFESLPSHQEKPVHVVYWFFFLSARWKGLEQGGGAQRRKQSAQCNNDDRSLRLKQGGIVGAAF